MKYIYSLLILLLSVFFISCGPEEKKANSPVPNPEITKSIFFADGFQIESFDSGLKKLLVFDLENLTDTIANFWLIDYAKFKGEMPEGEIIAVPVTNFACRSTTHLAFFNFLEKTTLVKGVSYANYANNPLVKSLVKSGEIKNLTTGEEIDLEILTFLSPQVFTTYPYGNINGKRIKSLGITSIPIVEYLEDSPLKRAEWIKLFGVLVGEEERAVQGFNALMKEYQNIQDRVRTHVAPAEYPTVFTGSADGGKWSAPSGKSLIAQFIKDAGGKYVFDDNMKDGNIELEFEAFYAKVIQTDYWGKVIYESDTITQSNLLGGDHRLDNLKAVKNNQIFYCNATKTDYFGDAIMQPEVILQDMVNVFHSDLQSDTCVYFKRFIP